MDFCGDGNKKGDEIRKFHPPLFSHRAGDSGDLTHHHLRAQLTRPGLNDQGRKRHKPSNLYRPEDRDPRYFLTLGNVHPQWQSGFCRYAFDQLSTTYRLRPETFSASHRIPFETVDMAVCANR